MDTQEKINTLINRVKSRVSKVPSRIETSISDMVYSCLVNNTNNDTIKCFYEPCVVCVLQSGKESLVGSKNFSYGAGNIFVVSVDIPSTYSFTDVSIDKPFIAISIKLNKDLLSSLIEKIGVNSFDKDKYYGASVSDMPEDVLDVLLSLTDLEINGNDLDKSILSTALKYQFFYKILTSEHGSHIFNFYYKNSSKEGILRSVEYLKEHYKENFDIDVLATDIGRMQPSTFFKYFKECTGFSPLQFKKHLRLLEAKRRIEQTNLQLSQIAFDLGYESISQFSREFKKVFSYSPSKTKTN